LQLLGVSKMPITALQPQSDDMVECFVKTVERDVGKFVASCQRDWEAILHSVLLAYRAATRDTTGLTPTRIVFRRDIRLLCNLLFGAPPDKERPTIVHAADLVDSLHDIQNYARRHLKPTSDRMKTRRPPGQLCGLVGGRQSVTLSPNAHQGKSPKI
jgi:hypothetical protein